MSAATAHKPIVHFVGSIPLPDAETVFRTLAAATTPHLKRLPDGETGIRRTWIRFLQRERAVIEADPRKLALLRLGSAEWQPWSRLRAWLTRDPPRFP